MDRILHANHRQNYKYNQLLTLVPPHELRNTRERAARVISIKLLRQINTHCATRQYHLALFRMVTMTIFEKLQQARLFRQRHLALLRTLHDLEMVWEIGLHQEAGAPLNPKRLSLLKLGPAATIRRRLRRLRELGLVLQRSSAADKRIKHLTLSAALKRRLGDYGRILVAA
jgi:hypothetical protein